MVAFVIHVINLDCMYKTVHGTCKEKTIIDEVIDEFLPALCLYVDKLSVLYMILHKSMRMFTLTTTKLLQTCLRLTGISLCILYPRP